MNNLTRFIVFGVAGWAIENVLYAPRYSHWLGGERIGIPFLPVYAVGGLLIGYIAPHVQHLPWIARASLYGTVLTGLEYGACKAERALGHASWGYGPDGSQCIDLPHAIAWSALGVAAEFMTYPVIHPMKTFPSANDSALPPEAT